MELTKDKSRHHHGNLHAALVEAGIEILRSSGLDALSLRKCAALAGVSHAAPAHHFGNLEGLKWAIAEEAFARFSEFMRTHAAASDNTAHGRLLGICRGYLAFARAEPALYEMIFCLQRKDPESKRDASTSYSILRDTCAPFVPSGTDPVIIETQVWSLVHGFALLELHGRLGDTPPPDDAILALLRHIGQEPA